VTTGPLLPPGGEAPPLDGVTPVFEEVGADPRNAPGLDRPPGSLCRFGTAYFWHNDTGPTAWVPTPWTIGGGGGGATVASWSLASIRYFVVDYDAGNDANAGFVDAAPGATIAGAAVAIKTLEQLYSIVPTIGNGRSLVVLIKNRAAGANYLDKDGVTQSSLDTSRWLGYATKIVRGSTDLTNSANDRFLCGFITAIAGPNGDGSFTVDVGPTTTTIPLVGGGLTVDAGVQFRVRILTGARAGQVKTITANSATTLTLGNATSGGAVTAGDTVIIERPGVRLNQCNFDGTAAAAFSVYGSSTSFLGSALVGVAFTTTASEAVSIGGGQAIQLCGVEIVNATANQVLQLGKGLGSLWARDSWFDEVGSSRTTGFGLRINCAAAISRIQSMDVQCLGAVNSAATISLNAGRFGNFGGRSYVKGNLSVVVDTSGGFNDVVTASGVTFQLGDGTTTNAPMRMVSGGAAIPFTLVTPCDLRRINFENFAAATHGAIYCKHIVGGGMVVDGCSSDGTPQYAMDIHESTGLTVQWAPTIANTLAGTTGDVLFAGSALVAGSVFAKTNVMDPSGNHVIGSAGVVASAFFSAKCSGADGLALGEPCLLDTVTANAVAAANWDLAANATCVAIACNAAAQNAFVIVATAGKPYVLNTGGTYSQGAIAFVATGTGGVGIATSTAVPSGKFQQRLGRWVSGTGGVDGYLAFNPEQVPIAVP
jgi:hypothetical protein